ncbi:penicillin-binding transpeptidase domain-containing protein [Pseudomonas aeruginosa]
MLATSASRATTPTCSSPASASRPMPSQLATPSTGPLYNRVLRGLYPPGSTVKPAVALAGLDAGVVTSTSRVFDPGYYQLPNYDHKYRNWNRYGDGWVSLESAIYRSNDTYFYDLAHKLGSTACTPS